MRSTHAPSPRARTPSCGVQRSLPDQTLSYHTDVLYNGLYAYLGREVL